MPSMRSPIRPAPTREADNELYDHACELVEAAVAVRNSADRSEAVRALPAVLGCVQEAIRELTVASGAMERSATEALQAGPPVVDADWKRRVTNRMHRGFENMSAALEDAQQATGACRALASRALAVA